MKRYTAWDEIPRGFRWYATNVKEMEGIVVPIPVYWLLRWWRDLVIFYLGSKLTYKRLRDHWRKARKEKP